MNLLLLAVWCGLLLSCTVSLPRKRQVKYPVTKFQNSHYKRSHPTALEVLERTLLRPTDRRRKHCNIVHSGRKRSAQQYGVESTSPMYSLPDRGSINSCVAAFGDQSPLCKTRKRQKKSFVGIPDIHKRLFRSDPGEEEDMPPSPIKSDYDFFGVFKSSDVPFVDTNGLIPNFDISTVAETSVAKTPNATGPSVSLTPLSNTKQPLITVNRPPESTEIQSRVSTAKQSPITIANQYSVSIAKQSSVNQSHINTVNQSPIGTVNKSPTSTLYHYTAKTVETTDISQSPIGTVNQPPTSTVYNSTAIPVMPVNQTPSSTVNQYTAIPVMSVNKSPTSTAYHFTAIPVMPVDQSPESDAIQSSQQAQYSLQEDAVLSTVQAQMVIPVQSSLQPTWTGKYIEISSIGSASNIEAANIILPGNVQSFQTDRESLFVKRVEGPDPDPKYDKLEIEESGDDSHSAVEESSDVNHHDDPENHNEEHHSTEETSEETELTTELTLPPLKNSVLTGRTYSKAECESDEKTRCICSFSSVDSDFQTIFSKADFEEEVMAEVANMVCRQYTAAPNVFDLNTNTKPRVLKGKHTPFALDNRQGAKEVTEKSLDEFIIYSAVDDGITRVFVSSDVQIPCFPKPDIHLSATDADHVKYTWTFGNKKQTITQGRITEDSEGTGSLTIEDIELTDAMNYTCEIDYIHPDTGERTTDVFVHTLSVVTLPTVSARAMVHYKSTAACDESLLEMFEMYLPQEVEKAICTPESGRKQLCSVVVHSPVCHSEVGEGKSKREVEEVTLDGIREKRESSMEMSLNMDVFVHRPAAKQLPGLKAGICDPDCHLLLNFKILQILKESLQEVALVPIVSAVQGGGTFNPEHGSIKVKYIFGCIGGYYLDNGFCLACPKGTFSDDGATECQECPLHTYSGSVGTRKCTPCRFLWMPVCNEHFESINILMIVLVVIGVILVLVAFVVYYVFFYKGQTFQEILKKGPKEKIAKSERARSKKEAKRIKQEKKKLEKEAKKKAKLKEQEELKRLVESTAESETAASETETESEHKEKGNR